MSIVLDEQGTPAPPTEIVARLGRVHPSLGLKFGGYGGRPWSLTWTWPETDLRWERVRSSEISPESAYDVIGSLPMGCGVDEAAGYVERSFKDYPVEEVSKLRDRMHHYNAVEVPQKQVELVANDALEDFASSKRQKNPRRTQVLL